MERYSEDILVINPGWEQKELVNFAISNFYNVHALFFKKKHIKFKGFKSYKVIDFKKRTKILSWLKNLEIKQIFSDQCDYSLYLQSFLCSKLNIDGPSLDNGLLSSNKKILYKKCIDLNINIPKTYYLKNEKDLKKFKNLKKKIILKPSDNRGSIGVSLVNNLDQLQKNFKLARKNSFKKEVVVQEFIHGKNIIIESNGTKNMIIGEKKMNLSVPYMNDDIIFETLNKRGGLHEKIKQIHLKNLKKINFIKGNISAEYIIDINNKLWLIELTNRGGGVKISSIIKPYLTGYNTYYLLYKDLIHKNKIIKKRYKIKKRKFIYLKYINFIPGYINKIKIKKNLDKMLGYIFLYIWNKPPFTIKKIVDATKRSGILITYGKTKKEAKEHAENIIKKIQPNPII